MRSLLSTVALLLAALVATISLAAYVVHESLLAPERAGRVLSAALDDPSVRDRALAAVLPEYDALPERYRKAVDRTADNPEVKEALSKIKADDRGRVDSSAARDELVRALRSNGQAELAGRVAATPGPESVRLPKDMRRAYLAAGDTTWLVATRGAIAATALALLGILLARRRRWAIAIAGLGAAAAAGGAVLLYSKLPAAVEIAGAGRWAEIAADAAPQIPSAVNATLLVVAVGGAVLLLGAALAPRSRG